MPAEPRVVRSATPPRPDDACARKILSRSRYVSRDTDPVVPAEYLRLLSLAEMLCMSRRTSAVSDTCAHAAAAEFSSTIAVAFVEPQASLLGHQLQFAGPGVPQRHRPQAGALPVEGDDLRGDPLLRHIVAGQLEDHAVFGHRSPLDALAPVEPGQVGDEAFDDKRVFVRVREYQVPGDRTKAFTAAYAADGAWGELFGKATGFLGTELYRDAAWADRFLTIYRWQDEQDWRSFLNAFGPAYEDLEAQLEGLAAVERSLFEGSSWPMAPLPPGPGAAVTLPAVPEHWCRWPSPSPRSRAGAGHRTSPAPAGHLTPRRAHRQRPSSASQYPAPPGRWRRAMIQAM
jgi:heme-degrading monooxygenase HmoA